jgi:hypothetical protein
MRGTSASPLLRTSRHPKQAKWYNQPMKLWLLLLLNTALPIEVAPPLWPPPDLGLLRGLAYPIAMIQPLPTGFTLHDIQLQSDIRDQWGPHTGYRLVYAHPNGQTLGVEAAFERPPQRGATQIKAYAPHPQLGPWGIQAWEKGHCSVWIGSAPAYRLCSPAHRAGEWYQPLGEGATLEALSTTFTHLHWYALKT